MFSTRSVLVGIAALACSCAEPEPPRPPALTDTSALQPQYREGAAAVASYLAQRGEDPKKYYVIVAEPTSGNELEFNVMHELSFAPEKRYVVGNPSGKDGVVYYDSRAKRVTKMLFFQ